MEDWYMFVCQLCVMMAVNFLARRDEIPESYCRTVGVHVRVHENFNLAYNSWTTIGRAFIFHMCIPLDKTFPWVQKCWPNDLDLEFCPNLKKN